MDSTARLEAIQIPVTADLAVAGVLGFPQWWPTGSRIGVVLAHDAPGSQETELLVDLQRALAERGYLCLRFNFPFAEQDRKRADREPLLERTFRAAAASLLRDPQSSPSRLVVGGIGLGGRIASQVIAQGLKVDALMLFSYPLHPPGKPGQSRADALFRIICPTLFVQGTRDATCRIDRLQALLRRIGAPTQLRVVQDGDHALDVVKRSERTAEAVRSEVLSVTLQFLGRATGGP